MTKKSTTDVGFYLVGGYDLLGYQTDLDVVKRKLLEKTHVLGDSWEESDWPGVSSAQISQKGFYDDESDGNNEALLDNVGVAVVLCLGDRGNTIGQKFVGFSGAMGADYSRIYQHAQFTKAEAMFKGSGIVEEGVILHTHSAETAASGDTEDSGVDDNAGSSSDGGSGYLQVSALTLGGYTNLALKVRDSSDDITYGDLIAFTAVTAAPAAERKTVSGTVERYLASSYAFTGAGSGQTATFMVGFYRT